MGMAMLREWPEALRQPRMAVAKVGRLAELGPVGGAVQRKATPGFDQGVTFGREAAGKIIPALGIGEIFGKERAQRRDEPLIRPDGLLRADAAIEFTIYGLPDDRAHGDIIGAGDFG
jgi:hypothetical protein